MVGRIYLTGGRLRCCLGVVQGASDEASSAWQARRRWLLGQTLDEMPACARSERRREPTAHGHEMIFGHVTGRSEMTLRHREPPILANEYFGRADKESSRQARPTD